MPYICSTSHFPLPALPPRSTIAAAIGLSKSHSSRQCHGYQKDFTHCLQKNGAFLTELLRSNPPLGGGGERKLVTCQACRRRQHAPSSSSSGSTAARLISPQKKTSTRDRGRFRQRFSRLTPHGPGYAQSIVLTEHNTDRNHDFKVLSGIELEENFAVMRSNCLFRPRPKPLTIGPLMKRSVNCWTFHVGVACQLCHLYGF